MRRSLIVLFLLSACKTTLPSGQAALAGANSSVTIDWSKNSELTNAAIVHHSCDEKLCETSPAYELGLEKEFWRHVHREDFRGMESWYEKSDKYVRLSSDREKRPAQMGRLNMLLGFSQGMLLLELDLQTLVPLINDFLTTSDEKLRSQRIADIAQFKGIKYLLAAIIHDVKANELLPHDLNARTLLLVVGSFSQGAMPEILGLKGLTGPKAYIRTLYGPSCVEIPKQSRGIFGDLCYDRGLMGPTPDSYKGCVNQESCAEIGAGTEGLLAGAMSMVSMQDHVGAKTLLRMLGDGERADQIASCDSYWCSVNHPQDPSAPVPEATSLTPFKKIGSLLAVAEAYGKVGDLKKMEHVLKAARAEASRLNYPVMEMIERVEASLHGGDPKHNVPDVLKAWKNPDPRKDILGVFQFPFPVSVRKGNCVSCHYGGVLPARVQY